MTELSKLAIPPAEHFMRDREAAEFIGVRIRSLQQMRYDGTGPVYRRVGKKRCVYRRADLLAWLDARGFISTTQEAERAAQERKQSADVAA